MSHRPENNSAGTQVVALVEIGGPNKSLVHPRGAVGVVTRMPAAGNEHQFQCANDFEFNATAGMMFLS